MSHTVSRLLRKILPDVLPNTPEDCVSGSQLTKLLKEHEPSLSHYNEQALQDTLYRLSGVPDSPIARYHCGNGYYLRCFNPEIRRKRAPQDLGGTKHTLE